MSNETCNIGRAARERVTDGVAETQRDASVDVARGVAIIGIVLTHVLRGLDAAHLLGDGAWIAAIDRVLCLWELSVFAFISGLFVAPSVSKHSLRAYLWEREYRFLVIYLLWTAVQGAVELWASRLVNHQTSIGRLLRVWAPTGQLWYLPFLMAVMLVFVPTRPWRPERAPWLMGLAAALSIALWGLDGGVVGAQGLGLVVFFVGGTVIGANRLRSVLRSIPTTVAGLGGVALFAVGVFVAVCTQATPPTTGWAGRTVSTVAIGVMLSATLSAAVLFVARGVQSLGFLVVCGRRSLDIFLAHIILASGSRIILAMLGLHSVALFVAAGLVAGVLGSLVVSAALRGVGLGWVFDGPKSVPPGPQAKPPARTSHG